MKGLPLPVTLRLYRSVSGAAGVLVPAWLSYRVGKGKEDPTRLAERRGYASIERPEGPLIWVHGASVGEVNSVLPLTERLLARGFNILLTSGTVTSSRVAARRAPPGVIHQFAPLDAIAFVRRFLAHWSPDLVLLAESELWPNLISELGRRGTPLVLVNGRLSPRSSARWTRLSRSARAILSCVDLCLAQTEEDAKRFRALGTPRIEVAGNLKFDVPAPGADHAALEEVVQETRGRPIFLAASTHPGEDELVIAAHQALVPTLPDLLTVIVPRHPERGGAIKALAESAGLATAQRSLDELPDRTDAIYVADTLGELGLFYRLAEVVFVGGSLVRHGGQNPIEPAKLGAAILHGPHVWNFAAVYHRLDAEHGALPIEDGQAMAKAAHALFADRALRGHVTAAARTTVDELGGALERTLHAIEPYLVHIRLSGR